MRPPDPKLKPCETLLTDEAAPFIQWPAPTAEWRSQPLTRWQLGYYATCCGLRDCYGRPPL
jgi:hypothetical protein